MSSIQVYCELILLVIYDLLLNDLADYIFWKLEQGPFRWLIARLQKLHWLSTETSIYVKIVLFWRKEFYKMQILHVVY